MPSCYDRLTDQSTLRKAWRRLNKSNKQSHGFDNETIQKFRDHLDENLANISKKLKERDYKFTPLRAKPIPKGDGGVRILRIPAVRDRVVLTGLKMLIEHRFRKFDRPCSFGYVKGRSRLEAIG
jgi:RNA-directed DNA polymerase